ncbi:hypothetical protein AcV5_006732 [Taiwanofungus camphoratus]|nr:hypothetical protein AcV5_006732 [Antrodia cinnamomea]KAI0935335.1 hypothetical protein AcV7_003805 [Antrodia cinnamomea]
MTVVQTLATTSSDASISKATRAPATMAASHAINDDLFVDNLNQSGNNYSNNRFSAGSLHDKLARHMPAIATSAIPL